MARSGYIAILKKSEKGLELVSSLQHSAKNMLERLHTAHQYLTKFHFYGTRIQKK